MGSAGAILIYQTERIFKNIILFWTLCALDQSCAVPIDTVTCNSTKMKMNVFAGMHEKYFLRFAWA